MARTYRPLIRFQKDERGGEHRRGRGEEARGEEEMWSGKGKKKKKRTDGQKALAFWVFFASVLTV